MKDIISFIQDYKSTKGIKISISSISNLKHCKLIWKQVPKTKETIEFCYYIKSHYPYFDTDLFMSKY